MRKCFLLLVFSLFYFIGKAQKKIKPSFTSSNQFGIAWGATGDGLQLQTINGLTFPDFSAGLGMGLDYYGERTIPFFIDIRKDLFSKKQTPFVYADFGTHLPWVKEAKTNTWFESEYGQGLYYDLGIGYKMPAHKKFQVIMSLGYTEKRLKETRKIEMGILDFPPHDRDYSEKYNYTWRRLSLKAGLCF